MRFFGRNLENLFKKRNRKKENGKGQKEKGKGKSQGFTSSETLTK